MFHELEVSKQLLEHLIETGPPYKIQFEQLDTDELLCCGSSSSSKSTGEQPPHIRTRVRSTCTTVCVLRGCEILGKITKKSKPSIPKKKLFPLESIEIELAELLLNSILSRRPEYFGTRLKTQSQREAKLQLWAVEVDKIIRIDGRDPDEVREVIVWSQKDSFWCSNICSIAKLRIKYGQLTDRMIEQRPGPQKILDIHPATTQLLKEEFQNQIGDDYSIERIENQNAFIEAADRVHSIISLYRVIKIEDFSNPDNDQSPETFVIEKVLECVLEYEDYCKQNGRMFDATPQVLLMKPLWKIFICKKLREFGFTEA